MEQQTLAALLDLLSLQHLLEAALLIGGATLLVHGLRLLLDRLALAYPRYRLQLAQGYPAMRLLIWVATLAVLVLGVINPPDRIIFALLGSAGLAVGLAAQDGIRNLLAGVIMIFNPPFRIGDMIAFNGHYGEVVRLDLTATWLQTFDDNTVMIPNAELLRVGVANSNSGELTEMVVMTVDLPWQTPLRLARRLASEAARASPYTYLKKPVGVTISERHETGSFVIRLTVKAYVVDVRLERRMASDITERLIEALQAEGVMMAGAAALSVGRKAEE